MVKKLMQMLLNRLKIQMELNNKGFSFIELMVVVIILGILAGMIVPRYMGRTDDAKVVKARVDIAAIETSLKLYRLDNGFYPTTEQGLKALIEQPTTEPVPAKWNENGYLDKRSIPKDPWGREYLYLCPGVNGDYDILSYGADGAPGGEGKNQDIKSWELD
jgi:general secretion pathway protein G